MNVTVKLIVPHGITLDQLGDELFHLSQFKHSALTFTVNASGTLTITASKVVPQEEVTERKK